VFSSWGTATPLSIVGCTNLHSHQQCVRVPSPPSPLYTPQHWLFVFWQVMWNHNVYFICISLMTMNVDHFSMYILAICISLFVNYLFICPLINWIIYSFDVSFFFKWDWVWTQSFVLAKQVLYYLSHTSSPFYSGYFGDGSLTNYLPRLASNLDPMISASQLAKFIGVSHWCLAWYLIFWVLIYCGYSAFFQIVGSRFILVIVSSDVQKFF
jgi:hypothetical protein